MLWVYYFEWIAYGRIMYKYEGCYHKEHLWTYVKTNKFWETSRFCASCLKYQKYDMETKGWQDIHIEKTLSREVVEEIIANLMSES